MNAIRTLICGAMMAAAATAGAADGWRVDFFGDSHALLRVEEPKRYLLLPIEDNAPEAEVRVVADNAPDKTFRARLAMNHVDYYVPFDLSSYNGRYVALDLRTESGRDNVRAAQEAVWSKNFVLSDTFDTTNRERFRPSYHHTPSYGWMNDPNGMFYANGEWHLCYQWGPYGSTWNNMTWGHSVSTDLVSWRQLPVAIEPNGLGMIFSGSCVVDTDNTAGFGEGAVVAFYTSADRSQVQSMAYSTDGGLTFTPYPANPVISSTHECRDPHVFRHEESGKWILILAAAQDHEMWIYSSSDLKNWAKESAFGHGYGCQDGVWECPDLIELPVRGTQEKKWVLICNINPGGIYGGSATQYFVGSFDGKTFTCDTKPEVTKWMDYGKDHYAAVSWSGAPDGRHTVVAWMSNWQYAAVVPTKQFRSANTLPRDVELWRADDGEVYLASLPSPEILAARGKAADLGSFSVKRSAVKAIPADCQGKCEIEIELDCGAAEKVGVELSNKNGDKLTMAYDLAASTFAMDRAESGLTDFSADFPAVTAAPAPAGSTQRLRLFVDSSSVEAFEGEGRFAMTNLVFPTAPYDAITFTTDGKKIKIKSLKVYPIKTDKK